MTPEQILANAQGLADTSTTYQEVLEQAADIAMHRRLFSTEQWYREWANTPVNLAGPVPAEYNLALETAHLIVEGHQS